MHTGLNNNYLIIRYIINNINTDPRQCTISTNNSCQATYFTLRDKLTAHTNTLEYRDSQAQHKMTFIKYTSLFKINKENH